MSAAIHTPAAEPAAARDDLVSKAFLNRLSMRLALAVLVATVALPTEGLGVTICWFKGLYGLPCPGCGMTRSLTSLTHLHLEDAFHYHPFGFVVWGLMVVLAAANFVSEARRRRAAEWLARHGLGARRAYLGFVAAFVAFGLIRMAVAFAVDGAFEGL